ncbi:hypothetical protein C8P68_109123 [Mucilaginibacter yixingensis]|uniref:Uncharacterized protein n=1 Tax=Mucilaginibacter yixingensis TaxID=1295612 RepID=A0A2T5J5J6_9SPHI|nr:hypothetical protein [Mucilaginibacter yixingensis]PTQ93251.1 hypothetical protein C8P68_109123 [Mucilaginibacter yixingensis]
MLVENPLALRYILPDDVYLLRNEKPAFAITDSTAPLPEPIAEAPIQVTAPAAEQAVNITETPAPIVAEPVINITPPQPIVQIPVVPQPATQTPASAFKYLGGFGKQFLVLVNYPAHEFMDDAHLNALEATLGRIGFIRADIAIFNLHQHAGKTYAEIREHFKPERTLIMGADALPQGLKQPPTNQVIRAGNRSLLYTFSFTDMLGNKENTRAFWEQVKTI